MFKHLQAWVGVAVFLAAGAAGSRTFAAVIAYDDASAPVYADGFQTGDNGGFGFQPWTVTASNGGFFTTNENRNFGEPHKYPAPSMTTNGWYFGLWHNNDGESVAVRPFAVALTASDRFTVALDHGWVDDYRQLGLRLRNADGATRFEFKFVGGSGGGYRIVGDATQATAHGWTPQGSEITFQLTSADTYAFSVHYLDDNTTETFTGALAGSGVLTEVAFFSGNQYGGWERDFYINKLQLEAVPEPASLMLLGILGVGLALRRRA